jgi:hypothetical protein
MIWKSNIIPILFIFILSLSIIVLYFAFQSNTKTVQPLMANNSSGGGSMINTIANQSQNKSNSSNNSKSIPLKKPPFIK